MAYLRIGRTTLYLLTKTGELPYYKVRGDMRFRQEDIDAYLDRQRSTR